MATVPEGTRAAREHTQLQREQRKRSREASGLYQAMVGRNLDRVSNIGRGAAATTPITGGLGAIVGTILSGGASLAEREMEGKFAFGPLGEFALRQAGAGFTEAEFVQAYTEGLVDKDGKPTEAGRKAAKEGKLEGLSEAAREVFGDRRRVDTTDRTHEARGEAQISPVRAQTPEQPLAEEPKKKKLMEEAILNPQLFEEPMADVPGVGQPEQVPSWLRRVQADIERARGAGRAEAFI